MSKVEISALMRRADAFWEKVDRTEGCWLWRASVDAEGYGKFQVPGVASSAHRYAYLIAVGSIPDGMHIDHVCHSRDAQCAGGKGCLHRRCVNPAHLEAVTPRENVLRSNGPAALAARRTHCPQGHPYDEANTAWRQGRRKCRACDRAAVERRSEWRRARRAEMPPPPPPPAAGQIWQDCDPRSGGRKIRIVAIEGDRAVVELYERRDNQTPSRRTRVLLNRFRPRRGYRFVGADLAATCPSSAAG